MSAESINLVDCSYCRSAGSVRNGRCDVCDSETERTRSITVEGSASSDDRGTLSTTSG